MIGIATRYDLTLDELYEVSGLDENSMLQPGQEIVVGFQPRPEEVGGSTNSPGETPEAATPSPTAPPTPTTTPSPTATIVEATAVSPATPAAVPTNALATQENGRSPGTILPTILGVIGLLAIGGAILLFLSRKT
jgi:hypothetical protein